MKSLIIFCLEITQHEFLIILFPKTFATICGYFKYTSTDIFSITFLGLLRTFDHKIQKRILHAITELHDFLRQGLFMEIFLRLGELFLRTIKVIDMDFFDRHSIILLFRIFRPFKSIVVHASINSSNKSTKY